MDFDKLMEYQNLVQNRLRSELNLDRKISFISLINQLTPQNKAIQKEKIMIIAKEKGYESSEVSILLDALLKEKILVEPMPGYIQRK